MNNLTPAQQRQQSNRTADGKYTTKQHSEAEVDLGLDDQPQRIDEFGNDWTEVFAAFEQPGRFKMQILHPHYDDEYSDDYIDAELSGNMERVWEVREEEQHWEWEEQAVSEAIDYELQQRDIDPDDARGTDLYEQLRDVIHDSEHIIHPSESIRDNTSHKLMRMEVFEGENLTDANEDAYHDDEARFEVLQAKFKELGLDPDNDVNKAAIEEMVYQGPEYWHDGVSLDVIWSGHYKDAVPGAQDKTLEFKDPRLVLIDSFNGSGWDAEVSGTIKRTIGTAGEHELPRTKRAYLDNRAGGYGWNDIAAPHQPAYDTEVSVTQPDTEQQPANA